MGNHRAERRGLGRRPSVDATPRLAPAAATPGKRRATTARHQSTARVEAAPRASEPSATTTTSTPAADARPGRRAQRPSGPRGALLRGVPAPPILLGIAALAISAGGAVTAADGGHPVQDAPRFSQASALSGASDVSRVSLVDKQGTVSRDSRRDALSDRADDKLVAQAESQARQRDAALAKLTQLAQRQADRLRLNQWILPVSGYRLTAAFGQYSGLWAHFHTGLDFAAPSGTPIRAIANGVITSVGYDGAYGNKTVLTLDDGTELWFCHQTSYTVTTGQQVRAGDVIGYVGSTGNVTGPHLHLEVRPGAGDPVDPYQALVVHGLTP